jgi:hypothetical protein
MLDAIPNQDDTETFCLTVGFDQGVVTPHKLFQSIADMIQELQKMDKALLDCIDSELEPVFILDEVEKGSLKLWLRQLIKHIPDEALMDLDIKKVLGSYLVRGKHKILEKLGKSREITTSEQVQPLIQEIHLLAAQYHVHLLGVEREIDAAALLTTMDAISKIAGDLPPGSNFTYDVANDSLKIGKNFRVPQNYISEILEHNQITNTLDMIIKVKKPDYLGNSRWIFRYNNRQIICDLEDKEWLAQFHARKVDVRPGDSLKVKMEISASYDKNNEVIAEKYIIKEVLEVIGATYPEQMSFPFDPSDSSDDE